MGGKKDSTQRGFFFHNTVPNTPEASSSQTCTQFFKVLRCRTLVSIRRHMAQRTPLIILR